MACKVRIIHLWYLLHGWPSVKNHFFFYCFFSYTKLPVILKGILTHEDAKLALNSGCKGIIVSNHGARQLDTVSATIETLPEIIKAVGTQMSVMIDGGVRNGTLNNY